MRSVDRPSPPTSSFGQGRGRISTTAASSGRLYRRPSTSAARGAEASPRGGSTTSGACQWVRRGTGPRIPRSRGCVGSLAGHLAQLRGADVVDETAHVLLVRNEGTRLDARDRVAHVLLEVVESFDRPVRLEPRVFLNLPAELLVGEGEHAAVGVVDEHDLLGAQQPLRD